MKNDQGQFVLRASQLGETEMAEALVVVRTRVHGVSRHGNPALLPDQSLMGAVALVLPGQPEDTRFADMSDMVTVEARRLRVVRHADGFCSFQYWHPKSGWGPVFVTPPALREDWTGEEDEYLRALAAWGRFEWTSNAERTRAYRELSVADYHRMMQPEALQFIEAVHARAAPRKSVAPIPTAIRGSLPPLPKPRDGRPVVLREDRVDTGLAPARADG